MLQALELLPDEPGSALIRRDWQLLRDAGLPSMLDHRGSTNAPHVTAIAASAIDETARALAAELMADLLPVTTTLTGLVVLGRTRLALARVVEVPDELVAAVLTIKAAMTGHRFPGWLPHATLARGLDGPGVARALAVVDAEPTLCVLSAIRFWNPETGTADTLGT